MISMNDFINCWFLLIDYLKKPLPYATKISLPARIRLVDFMLIVVIPARVLIANLALLHLQCVLSDGLQLLA